MTLHLCRLTHDLHLVIEVGRYQRAAEDYPGVIPPTRAGVDEDLNVVMAHGVPAFLRPGRDGETLITFCTPRYEIECGPTRKGGGYYAYRLSPLSLRSHNQIARCALRVQPRRWVLHAEVVELKAVGDVPAGFDKIRALWEAAENTVPRPPAASQELTPAQSTFLNHVETLIDLACTIEQEKAIAQGVALVVSAAPAVAARLTGDTYRFRLAAATEFALGDYVRAGVGEAGASGIGYTGVIQTLGAQGREVQVRFHQFVDWDHVQQVAWLAPFVSTKQYRIQKDALQALRARRALNPAVLPAIVEGQFAPYTLPAAALALAELNPAQRDMVTRAVSVPDLLLALGPPGTGKTHTIRAIVRHQTARGHKVLITSKNNKAVDNVLEALHDVDALRIGREEAVSSSVQPLMIDYRARALQAQILANTEPHFAAMAAIEAAWPTLQQRLDALLHTIMEQEQARARLIQAETALRDWQRARYDDAAAAIERQTRRFHDASGRAFRAVADADALCHRMNWQSALCRLPWRRDENLAQWERMNVRWQALVLRRQAAVAEMEVAARNVQQIWEAYYRLAAASVEALRYKQTIVAAEQEVARIRAGIAEGLAQVQTLGAHFADAPRLEATADSPRAKLEKWWQDLTAWRAVALHRKDLLTDWRALLQTRHQALYPTLIQMAEVVGATCIGVATDARFEDLTFDLMIADEAGQIQVMDLLVPLVRARRAVLVGDDRQLPPVVEDDLRARLNGADETLQGWLEQSLFEQLFRRETTPESRKVMLDTQYRMPRVIADFISQQFYAGRYRTGREVAYTDPFFAAPLVLVDTGQERDRWERPAQEAEGIRGYINALEARVVADLVLAYHDRGVEWGVIVPYKKQAENIRRVLRLRRRALPEAVLQDWVATVDAFQGKERDLIIYGFTRSNARGNVGFLAELRRLNVSLTRAKRQLVLVGDAPMLTQARDAAFAHLMQALVTTVKTLPGGYLNVHDLRRQLAPD